MMFRGSATRLFGFPELVKSWFAIQQFWLVFVSTCVVALHLYSFILQTNISTGTLGFRLWGLSLRGRY